MLTIDAKAFLDLPRPFTDDELMTITAGDVNNSVEPLLRGLGLSVPT